MYSMTVVTLLNGIKQLPMPKIPSENAPKFVTPYFLIGSEISLTVNLGSEPFRHSIAKGYHPVWLHIVKVRKNLNRPSNDVVRSANTDGVEEVNEFS
jgi:hypothetical protein